jgi:hypothetical protein
MRVPRPFRRLILLAAVLVASLLPRSQALGWSSGGHQVVANVAYQLLDPDTRAKAVAMLRSHPRFKEDFLMRMPESVGQRPKRTRDRWLFLQAATWPDIARDEEEFNHKGWHFIDLPFFLSGLDKEALKGVAGIFPRTALPEQVEGDDEKLNAIQVLQLMARRLPDSGTKASKRAIYLCWLEHLVGDVHQPLHATSLYARRRFHNFGGDFGGNAIRVKKAGQPFDPMGKGNNLHSFWDDLLGKDSCLEDVDKITDDIFASKELKDAGAKAAKDLKVEDWMNESHKLAETFAYTRDILTEVAAKEADATKKLAYIELSEAYQNDAYQIALRRVAEAGYRLCAMVKQTVK